MKHLDELETALDLPIRTTHQEHRPAPRVDYGKPASAAVDNDLRIQAHEAAGDFAAAFMEAFGPRQEDLYSMAQRLMEKHLMPLVMKACHGNQSEVSRRLGLNRATTRKKLRLAKVPLRRLKKEGQA